MGDCKYGKLSFGFYSLIDNIDLETALLDIAQRSKDNGFRNGIYEEK